MVLDFGRFLDGQAVSDGHPQPFGLTDVFQDRVRVRLSHLPDAFQVSAFQRFFDGRKAGIAR